MAELAATSRSILETVRDRAPEIPALRYECKALLSRIAELAAETGSGVDCEGGTVRIEPGAPLVDPARLRAELPERLSGHMEPEAVNALIESTFTRKIAKHALAEMLWRPELAFLGYDSAPASEGLWDAVLVDANRHSATRVVPRL